MTVERLPSRNLPGGLFNWSAFKSAPFSVYCVSAFSNSLGSYTGIIYNCPIPPPRSVPKIVINYSAHKVLAYVDVSATSIGISSSFSFCFVTNAGSLVCRYVAGYMSNRLGMIKLCAQVFPIVHQYSTRSNENYDTLYSSSRNINLRLAIRQDEIVASRSDGSLWVMIFPKADCFTGLTDTTPVQVRFGFIYIFACQPNDRSGGYA